MVVVVCCSERGEESMNTRTGVGLCGRGETELLGKEGFEELEGTLAERETEYKMVENGR